MKKVLALTLAVVLAFGMCTVAFAAGEKVVDNGFNGWYDKDKAAIGSGGGVSVDLTEVKAGDEVIFYLMAGSLSTGPSPSYTAGSFDWVEKDGSTTYEPTKITTSMLTGSANKISLKRKVNKSGDVIKDLSWKNDGGNIKVTLEFVDPFVSTKEKEFDIEIYLSKSGWNREDTSLQVTGELKNNEFEVDENDEEIDLSEGEVAEATAYVKATKINTGNGLYINAKLYDGRKYYAKSDNDPKAADDAVLTQYPEIDTVYNLYTVGLATAGNTVEFDVDDTMYVYNAAGQYIGTTNDTLPMSNKYYLATVKIDMGEGEEVDDGGETPADDDTDGNIDNAETGGDDVPANVNDNPGTGSNGFVNVAVVAGVVALAAAGAVSLKK